MRHERRKLRSIKGDVIDVRLIGELSEFDPFSKQWFIKRYYDIVTREKEAKKQ